jgi:hypothetical protein
VAQPEYRVTLDGTAIDAAELKLTRLEVRESDSDPTFCALRFDLAQREDGTFALLDDDLFRPGLALGIDLAMPGGTPLRLFEGYVTHLRPHFETIAANSYVEVLGMDAAVLMSAEERAASWPDSSDAQIVDEVCGRYNLSFQGDDTDATWAADRQLFVHRGTDWDLVQRLARRNGFLCYLEPDPHSGAMTVFFRPRGVADPPQADLTLLRDGANLTWLDLQWVMTGPVRCAGAAIDPLAKRIVRAEGVPGLDPMGDGLLDTPIEDGLRRAGASAATALLRDPLPLEAALQAEGRAATDRALFTVEARGEVDPTLYRGLLRARRPVLIKGVGRTFAGAYWVRAVRTTVDEGVATQTFVAERNAVGTSGRERFGGSAEEVPAR